MNVMLHLALKALQAAQASLDTAQQALVMLAQEQTGDSRGGCDHPMEARITVDTMNGREELCNVCGANLS